MARKAKLVQRVHWLDQDAHGAVPHEEMLPLLEALDCPAILALSPIGCTQAEVRQGRQDGVPTSDRKRQGALTSGDSLVIGACDAELNG